MEAGRLTDGQLQGLLQRQGILGVRKVGADATKCLTALEDLEDNTTYLAEFADPVPMDTRVGGLSCISYSCMLHFG